VLLRVVDDIEPSFSHRGSGKGIEAVRSVHGETPLAPCRYGRPNMLAVVLALASAASFFYYGGETLFANPPRGEYERYGMPNLRVVAGSLQIVGGTGVLVGLWWSPVGAAAAGGLLTMMLLGLLVRYRLHDKPRLMVPAGTLAVLNAALLVLFIDR
jgi:hypothetical protein